MPDQSEKSNRPGEERGDGESEGEGNEKGQGGDFGKHEGGDAVHAERKDERPVLRIVGDRLFSPEVTPGTDQNEQGNPPSGGGPEEQGEAEEERLKWGKKWESFTEDEETCAREGGDGEGAHIDPVRWGERVAIHAAKDPAVENEGDQDDVKHGPEHVGRERNEGNDFGAGELRGHDRSQSAERFGGNDDQEPAAVDRRLELWFWFRDGDGGEEGVEENDPKEKGEEPESLTDRDEGGERNNLFPKDTRSSNQSEKSGAACMAGQILKECGWVFDEAKDGYHPEDEIRRDVEPEERASDLGVTLELPGHRDDAGSHDEREIAGEKCPDPRSVCCVTHERLLLHRAEIAEKAEDQPEADEAGEGGRDDDGAFSREVGFHGGGEEPELEDDDGDDQGENSEDDGATLAAGELGGFHAASSA